MSEILFLILLQSETLCSKKTALPFLNDKILSEMKSIVGRPLFVLFSFVKVYILCLSLVFFISGCLDEGRGREGDTEVVVEPDETPPPPLTSPERTVCDPFESGVSTRDRGIVGQLFYLEADQPLYTSTSDYFEHGQTIPSTIYLDRLFIPTRAFDLGFYTETGEVVLNSSGEPLYEKFALRMETQLALAENEQEGWYQLATLSDDGSSVILVDENGQQDVLIDNDGNHPTRMGCAVHSVYMTKENHKSAIITYHQGPRYHIAMTLLWRPLPEGADPNSPVSDIECGRSGNSRYFDSNFVPSKPMTPYYEILERGWKVLTNENYRFPYQASNPCGEEAPLLLSNFSVNSVTRTNVSVSWATNLPASSQLQLRNTTTGDLILSPLDSSLKTSHSVTLSGLSSNTLYSIIALSEDADGRRVESEEVAFRTPR